MTNLNINYLQDNTPVNAETTNKPLRQIVDYLDDLSEQVNAIQSKYTLTLYGQLINPNISEGDVVYFSPTSNQFEQALCSTTIANEITVSSDSMQVAGILVSKNGNYGNIVVQGEYTGPLNFQNPPATDTHAPSAIYYLSSSKPGAIVASTTTQTVGVFEQNTGQSETIEAPLPISIPVCCVTGFLGETNTENKYSVIVNSQWFSFSLQHKHYKFPLYARPCGDFDPNNVGTAPGSLYFNVVNSINQSIDGWMPISQFSQTDYPLKPSNAVLGYNISASTFGTMWPPVPMNTVLLTWKLKDENYVGGIPAEYCIINADGIWWMSKEHAPWDIEQEFTNGVINVNEVSYSPYEEYIWWTRPLYNTNNAIVESLTPKENSGVTLTDIRTGKEATSGNLVIGVDISQNTANTVNNDSLAIKNITNDGVEKGRVVTGLKVNSKQISATCIDEVTGQTIPITNGINYGLVTLSDDSGLTGEELNVDSVHLQNVRESLVVDNIALMFPAQSSSTLLGRITVPKYQTVTDITTLSGKFRFVVYTDANATAFNPSTMLKLEYRVISYPEQLNTPQDINLNGAWTVKNFASASYNINVGQGVRIESPVIDNIPLGAVLSFKLTRLNNTDAYNLMLIRKTFVVEG